MHMVLTDFSGIRSIPNSFLSHQRKPSTPQIIDTKKLSIIYFPILWLITFFSAWQTVVIYVKFSIYLKSLGKKLKIPAKHAHHWNRNSSWFGKQKLRKWWLLPSCSDFAFTWMTTSWELLCITHPEPALPVLAGTAIRQIKHLTIYTHSAFKQQAVVCSVLGNF